MLQNQRQTKNLYRIDSNQNLYRIILAVFTKKKQHMFTWYFLMWGYWFCRKDEFALSVFFLWKVLDFVEANILVWRAEIDLVKKNGTWPRGPLLDRGVQHLPPNCKGDIVVIVTIIEHQYVGVLQDVSSICTIMICVPFSNISPYGNI